MSKDKNASARVRPGFPALAGSGSCLEGELKLRPVLNMANTLVILNKKTDIGAVIRKIPPDSRVCFVLPTEKRQTKKLGGIADELKLAIGRLVKKGVKEIEVECPYCLLGQYALFAANKKTGNVKLKSCKSCAYDALCTGVNKGYLDNFGAAEFIPVKKEKCDHDNIDLTFKCNQNCIFCLAYDTDIVGHVEADEELVRQFIDIAYTAGKTEVTLQGGEPTQNVMLPYLARFLKKHDIKQVTLNTNGTLFSSKGKIQELVDAGIDIFNVAMPSHLEKVSDRITRTRGLFEKRNAAMRAIVECGGRLRVTGVICSWSYPYLEQYLRFIKNNISGEAEVSLNYLFIKGRAKLHMEVVPRLMEIKPHLEKAMDYARKNKLRLFVDRVPLCLMKDYKDYNVDYQKIKSNPGMINARERHESKKCRGCRLNSVCCSMPADYYRLFGDRELVPFK